MLSVAELFLIGGLGDWAVVLDLQGLGAKKLTKSILAGTNRNQHQVVPDQKSLELGKRDTLSGKEKSPEIGPEIGTAWRKYVSAPMRGCGIGNPGMTGYEIGSPGKRGITIETATGTENGTTDATEFAIGRGIETTAVTKSALVTAIVRGTGCVRESGIEIMGAPATRGIVATPKKEMLSTITWRWRTTGIIRGLSSRGKRIILAHQINGVGIITRARASMATKVSMGESTTKRKGSSSMIITSLSIMARKLEAITKAVLSPNRLRKGRHQEIMPTSTTALKGPSPASHASLLAAAISNEGDNAVLSLASLLSLSPNIRGILFVEIETFGLVGWHLKLSEQTF